LKALPFDDAAARAAWNRGAAAWREFVRSGADYYRLHVHGPGLLAACAVQPGERALDLGCGEGYFARELARAGARVVGIDVSEQQIASARAEEERAALGIEYRVASGSEIAEQFQPHQFDLIASCMAIADISDVAGVLAGAGSVLQPNGRLVFSVPHPCTDTPVREWERDASGRKIALKIDRYFDTGPMVTDWNMKRLTDHWSTPGWRHTLEEWSALIEASGLMIRRMREPRPTADDLAGAPELEDCSRVPYFLIFDLVRPPTG
jgi:2-polyprenyl-3-methyl-5-hydroxy-6-metoxy-1,4-benzoquinol methylase